MTKYLVGMATLLAFGCGGSGTDPIEPDPMNSDCPIATSDRYLPVDVGNVWQYRVTDPTGVDPQANKRQELVEEFVPEGDTEPAILQLTTKANGTTENWLRLQGDVVVRLQQQDFDATGLLERTTVYDPYNLRFDESAEHTSAGATWQVSYADVIYDAQGVELMRVDVIDEWSVVGVDVPCNTPWGELQCLQLHKERIQGGFTVKDYFFARGYGKVREEGAALEELIGCALQ